MSPISLQEAAQRAVETAISAGADDAEAFSEESASVEVRAHGGEVESLTEATSRGLGVRAWIGGRVGYAYGALMNEGESGGEDGVATTAARAAEAADVSDADEHAGPPEPDGAVPALDGLLDPSLAKWDPARKVELALAVEARALSAGEVVGVETSVYADERRTVSLRSSRGAEADFEAGSCYAYAQAIAAREAERQTGLGFGLARTPADLDPDAIGGEAADRATDLLGATKPESRRCPAVLDTTVAASLIGAIGGVLCADAVQRGRSPFVGLAGETIASDAFQLADDGLDPAGLAASPCDGEGSPRRRIELINGDGKLDGYLHDTYTARRAGEPPNTSASATRSGYRSPPAVGPSNLVVTPGAATFEELLAQAGEGGIFVTDVAGLHSGIDPVSGRFSVGASGRLIRDGQLAEPATEFTIASDLLSLLLAVRACGAEPRWVPFGGSVSTPPLLIDELTVAGR